MRKRLLLGAFGALAAVLVFASPASAQDAGPTVEEVKGALDVVWVIVAAVLVFFMQAGFALVEAGLTRGKNVANIMMKNLMDFSVGTLAFFAVGFAIMFGAAGNGLFGGEGFFLDKGATVESFGLPVPVFFLFQLVFAATAATIVSGAMAERTKFKSYVIYSAVITAIIYPTVGRWTFGGGWLADLGFIDFAGSTVVHLTGGVAAFAGAAIIGPRLGRYGADGKPRAIPGHSIPFAVLGTLILWVGWFGFNPGSTVAAVPEIGDIAVTTVLAGAMGAVMTMVVTWLTAKKPDVGMTCNGALAGLVGITAGCASVEPWAAVVIGAITGAVVVPAVAFFDRIKVDDPVGAISVHGVCGAIGTLCVGVFGSPTAFLPVDGLLATGSATQLGYQAIGVGAVLAFVGVSAGVLFTAIKVTVGLRVDAEEEMQGLDVVEHGAPGYGHDISFPIGATAAAGVAHAPGLVPSTKPVTA